MNSNGLVEQGFDFEAAEKKIKDLQTFKTALSFEISKNQQNAEELRERIKMYEEKIEEHKRLKSAVLKEVEDKISESEKLTSELRSLRIQREYEKNDSENLKKTLDSERNSFQMDKASWKERSELKDEQQKRRQIELDDREKTIEYKFKEADVRLSTIFEREEKLKADIEAASTSISSAELKMKEADLLKNEGQKILDEGKSLLSLANEKMKDVNAHREDLIARERNIRIENDVLADDKKKLKQEQRELQMEVNKLTSIRQRLIKEIENASVEGKIKEIFMVEAKDKNENPK